MTGSETGRYGRFWAWFALFVASFTAITWSMHLTFSRWMPEEGRVATLASLLLAVGQVMFLISGTIGILKEATYQLRTDPKSKCPVCKRALVPWEVENQPGPDRAVGPCRCGGTIYTDGEVRWCPCGADRGDP